MKRKTVEEIRFIINQKYPNFKIIWDTTNYKNTRSRSKFIVNGKIYYAVVEQVMSGSVKFKGSYPNITIKKPEDVLKKVIAKTKEKHPEFLLDIEIDLKTYVNTHTKCYFILNKKTKIYSTPFNLMSHGISLKDLGLKKEAKNKKDPVDILNKIQNGWLYKGKKIEARPFIYFDVNDYKGSKFNTKFIDSEYGIWYAHPYHILRGGCHPKRSKDRVKIAMRYTVEEAQSLITNGRTCKNRVGKLINIPPRNYLTIDKSTYKDFQSQCRFIDKDFGEFITKPIQVINGGQEHPKRSVAKSRFETEIEQWLESININCVRNRKFRSNKRSKEIDVFLTDYNVGIDFHGLYWHSEINRDKKNHFLKREFFEKQNIFLFQIYEDEWVDKLEIVKSLILSKINKFDIKIQTSKCEIKMPEETEAQNFLQNNHIQGKSSYKNKFIGLYFKNQLVSLLAYQNRGSKIEITRFGDRINTLVKDSLPLLLKNIPQKQINFSLNLRMFDQQDLINQGFVLKSIKLGFCWTDFFKTFTKKPNTERCYKIYDAGNSLLTYSP